MDEYKQQFEAVWPEVIGAVITTTNGTVNLCPVNYQAVSTAYESPATVCIGLGANSYSLQAILQSKEFVYAYPTLDQIKDVIYCGTVSGHDGDKIVHTKLSFTPAHHISPPLLDTAVLNYECALLHSYDVGGYTIVIGKVLAVHGPDADPSRKIYSFGSQQYGVLAGHLIVQQGR